MITIPNRVTNLAKRYSINPYGMIGIIRVLETVQRFKEMSSSDIANAVSERAKHSSYDKPPKYIYDELPSGLVSMLEKIITKYGGVDRFFMLENYEHLFISAFIANKYQPIDYLFYGSIHPRGLTRGEFTDNTTQAPFVVEYDGFDN